MRWVFGALAIWGAIHPMYYFVAWFQTNGWNIMAMVDAWHANDAASGLVWDLTIAAIALTIWVIYEAMQSRRWSTPNADAARAFERFDLSIFEPKKGWACRVIC